MLKAKPPLTSIPGVLKKEQTLQSQKSVGASWPHWDFLASLVNGPQWNDLPSITSGHLWFPCLNDQVRAWIHNTAKWCKPRVSRCPLRKMNKTQLVTTCEKFGLCNLPRTTQEPSGRGRDRIQLYRAAFNCLNYKRGKNLRGDIFCCINCMTEVDINKLSGSTVYCLRLLGEKQTEQS